MTRRFYFRATAAAASVFVLSFAAVALTDPLPHQSMCTVRAPTSRMTRRAQAFQDICVRLYAGRGGDAVRDGS